MFSHHRRKARFLFALADFVATLAAFLLAYQTRQFLSTSLLDNEFYLTQPTQVLLVLYSIGVWVFAGVWLDVYDRLQISGRREIIWVTLQQCGMAGIALILFEFLLRLDLSRFFLLSFVACNTILLTLFRLSSGRVVGVIRRGFGAPSYVFIVGLGDRALKLAHIVEQQQSYGLRLSGFLADETSFPGSVHLRQEYPVLPLRELPELLRQHIVDEILFAVDSVRLAELEEIFLLCDEEGVRTRIAVDFFPHVNSELYLDRLGPSPLLTFSAAPHDELLLFIKRVADVILASLALLVTAPLMLFVVLLIRVTSPGPAIFRQVRCGLNGRRFTFYKFRSMCLNAESMKAALAHMNQKDLAFKIPNDPRLTPIGRWLRKFSIDEWPQLWNVLKGDMSLVGPRPAIPEEVEKYKRWQRRRLRMRPGLTCLWALNGRDHLDFETWMKLDMQYIDNWSLGLDCKILLQTIPSVLTGRGAH